MKIYASMSELTEERVAVAYKQGCIDKEMHGLEQYKKGFAAGKLQGRVEEAEHIHRMFSQPLTYQPPKQNENDTHKTE